MSQLLRITTWQVNAGVQYNPNATLESLQGLPLTLIREEVRETLLAAKTGDYVELLDGCADIIVTSQALLHRLGNPYKTDGILRNDYPNRVKLTPQEAAENLTRVVNTINDEESRYNLDREELELLAQTALLSAKELILYCAVSPTTVLRLINDSNFSKFATTLEEADKSVQLYANDVRYKDIQIRPVDDYYVIVGRSEGQSELKVLKAIGYVEPKLKLIAKDARNNVELGVHK